jgi:hypothetical protein
MDQASGRRRGVPNQLVRRGCDSGHIRFERQDPCQRLLPLQELTTVIHTAWIVKIFDVGIGIPLLASDETSRPRHSGAAKAR